MNLVPLIPDAHDISDIVQLHGYRLTTASAANLPPFMEDLFLVLQFGNGGMTAADGHSAVAVDCAVRLRGAYPSVDMRRWMLRKSFFSRFRQRKVELTFFLDAALAGNPEPAGLRQRLAETVKHVQALVSDVRSSLSALSARTSPRVARSGDGPAVYIEAIAIGDLIAGRCGMLKSGTPSYDQEEVAKRIHICEVLECDVLPDIESTLRACINVVDRGFVPISRDAILARSLPDL